jgi:type VI secretion system ImpA/VasJ family protein
MSASILPLEDLVAPIAPDAPTGADLRGVSDDIDEIIKAGRADADLSEGDWVSKDRRVADWSKVIALSVDVLSKKSKDLVVAVRLSEALVVRHGMAGLYEGLWVIRQLIERYWDGLYPALEDGDVEYRTQPFVWFNDKVAWRLDEITPPEDYLPLADLEAVHQIATQCRDEFLAIYRILEQRCGRETPRVAGVHDRIQKYLEATTEVVERQRALEVGAAPDATAPTADGQPAARRGPVGSLEPVDRADALRRALLIATYLRKDNPCSPIGYRLARAAQWADASTYAASPPAQSDMTAPPTDVRARLGGLERDGSWSDLLEGAEEAVATPAGRFWLDLQRYAAVALENLGDSYRAGLDAVKDEVRGYVAQFPELPRLYLSDFTAVATPETQTWLATAIMLPDTSPSVASVDSNGNGSEPTVDVWREAQLRARAGQKLEALELIRGEIQRAACGRDAFTWKLRLAELCIGERLSKLAVPLLEELAEQVDRYHLDEWEPRDVAARVFSALYQCCEQEKDGSGDYEARARQSFARLCRLDVSRAFRDGNA